MPNERLRAALLEKGFTPDTLAPVLQVDAKTIERWITTGRTPYRRHRYALAAQLGMDEGYLWPGALPPEQAIGASESEIITVYPHRWTVPRDEWSRLFSDAEEEIDILVYAALFLAEDAGIVRALTQRAHDGVKVRMLFGDPDSTVVKQRGADENIGDESVTSRIRNALALFAPVFEADQVEVRLHDTILYNSIFRADDHLLVNPQIYGTAASNAPVLRLRRVAGGSMVTNYIESFERVWRRANPLE
jgi:phosphatidylserine/phosphatidylglycerophosphate/cardiolipin synthase-like enzyme